ncbi:TPA: flagellar protein [Candidatus Micrarchaeota archaeon]|nr:flagellar protein [Candidatus Micrarchaeota archaeon]
MIWLTGIGGNRFVLNAEHIEMVESLPDTTITLTNGRKYIVRESADEVIKLVIEYKRRIFGLEEIIKELKQGR